MFRVRIKLESCQVFNSSGNAVSSINCFSKALHLSSCGTEDNIESLIMERDTKDLINGLSEEKFVTSDHLQYLIVDAPHQITITKYTKERRAAPSREALSIVSETNIV